MVLARLKAGRRLPHLSRKGVDGLLKREPRPPAGERHIISNIVIKLNGDKASGLAYWTHMTSGPTGYGIVDFWDHYEDELVKVGGEWLFARRRI